MNTIYVGTTNTSGSGSAADLNADNATASLIDSGVLSVDGVSIGTADFDGIYTLSYAIADTWNKTGYKEAQIHNDSNYVFVDNFVDVDIVNYNDDGADITIHNAKRGTVDTGDGDDTILISTYSNNANWSNSFSINSGDGNDSITLTNAHNSQFTSYSINAGNGDDIVDVSGLLSSDSPVSRVVDGGDGFDNLVLSGQDTVDFSNFEAVTLIGDGSENLNLTCDILENNDSSEFGLIISNADISFENYDNLVFNYDLSAAQIDYLDTHGFNSSEFISVTANIGEDSYSLLTDDVDYSFALPA